MHTHTKTTGIKVACLAKGVVSFLSKFIFHIIILKYDCLLLKIHKTNMNVRVIIEIISFKWLQDHVQIARLLHLPFTEYFSNERMIPRI